MQMNVKIISVQGSVLIKNLKRTRLVLLFGNIFWKIIKEARLRSRLFSSEITKSGYNMTSIYISIYISMKGEWCKHWDEQCWTLSTGCIITQVHDIFFILLRFQSLLQGQIPRGSRIMKRLVSQLPLKSLKL